MQIQNKNIILLVRNVFILFLFIFLFTNGLKAQLVIKDNYEDYQGKSLVQKYFANSGIYITKVTLLGSTQTAIGSFTNGAATNLGINEGIVLSTGNVSEIPGNATDTISTKLNFPGSFPLKRLLLPGSDLFDETALSIDFISYTDSVKFNFVFASEEFPPFDAHSDRDVFGFFITGDNPLGGRYDSVNIALFPGTNIDIKIDSFAKPAYSQYYIPNNTGSSIKFNGFTKVLTAKCKVVPCQTYNLKLTVGDAKTYLFDSGIFLEASSFSSQHKTITVKGANGPNIMYEKCGISSFIFNRDYVTSIPETVNFNISGTAINVTDYTDSLGNPFPSSVTFPANSKQVELKVKAVDDEATQPNESTETISLKFTEHYSLCDTAQATLYIKNTNSLSVTVKGDTVVCNEKGDQPILTAIVTGGVPPYKFKWFNEEGDTGDTLESGSVELPKYDYKNEKPYYLYHVVVTDSCKAEVISSNKVKVNINCPIKTTNVFTPNGDGINDKFIIKHIGEYPNSQLVVLNRWGKKVYENNNYRNDWDGGNLADGVYFFVIKLSDGTQYQGSVTIIR